MIAVTYAGEYCTKYWIGIMCLHFAKSGNSSGSGGIYAEAGFEKKSDSGRSQNSGTSYIF